jgi:hypothetical protein
VTKLELRASDVAASLARRRSGVRSSRSSTSDPMLIMHMAHASASIAPTAAPSKPPRAWFLAQLRTLTTQTVPQGNVEGTFCLAPLRPFATMEQVVYETSLVWFRRDLRVSDNAALTAALACSRRVVPVFVWSPEQDGGCRPRSDCPGRPGGPPDIG